jgi:hypothetical protein
VIKFPWVTIEFPKVFGWAELAFMDRLKLMAFLAQGGAGVAMTVFAGYAMFELAGMSAVWPLFYLGMTALIIVGVVITGFASMLIQRQLEIRGPGGFVFRSQDASAAATVMKEMSSVQPVQPTDQQGLRRDDDSPSPDAGSRNPPEEPRHSIP